MGKILDKIDEMVSGIKFCNREIIQSLITYDRISQYGEALFGKEKQIIKDSITELTILQLRLAKGINQKLC